MKKRNIISRIGIYLVLSLFSATSLFSQSCYEIVDSYSGDLGLYDGLDDIACEINSFVTNGSKSNSFSVLGCDFYPSMAYTKENEALSFDHSHQRALEMMDATREGFIMVTKEHHSDGNVKYRLDIKYPDLPVFSNLNIVEKEAIHNLVESVLIESSGMAGPTAESKALVKFLSLLKNGVKEDLLTEAGFVKIISNNELYSRDGNLGQIGNVLDLCGAQVLGNYINTFLSADFAHMGFTTASVLTDNSCSMEEFDTAKSYMLNSDLGKDFHVWYHIDNKNGVVENLYYKGVSTISIEQIEIKTCRLSKIT